MTKGIWPTFSYDQFAPTSHLLHMATQMIGKLKLLTPFEPEWANVPLWITTRGLSTGLIPYNAVTFSINMDFIDHKIICNTSEGKREEIKLSAMSVAQFYKTFFSKLQQLGVDIKINSMPQEIPNPIAFDKDTKEYPYDAALVHSWWQILLNSYQVLQIYHAKFKGKTPPVGFMWGTFDLRDARYKVGAAVPTTGINAEYIRRNAMDEEQIEAGWWSGNPNYPRPAYYSFTYPEPKNIAAAKIKPAKAHWDDKLKLFILDYDDVRQSQNPSQDLLDFFDSAYDAGAKLAGWDKNLIGSGTPQ